MRDSPATRALLHTIKDMSEDDIRIYTNFIKVIRARGEKPDKRTIWRDKE